MKTFKQYITRTGVIPFPIHFKHVKDGVIPAPIHFKHVPKPKKHLKEEEATAPPLSSWYRKYDNTHLAPEPTSIMGGPTMSTVGDHVREVSRKLSENHKYKLTPEQENGIERYTAPGSGPGNSKETNYRLLHGTDTNMGGTPPHISSTHLSDAINKNPLPHDLHAYSGVRFDPTKHMDSEGKLRSPPFISTTHHKMVAMNFAEKQKDDMHHIIHFHLKAGDPALHVEPYSSVPGEFETIIDKGVTLQHHGTEDYHAKSDYPENHGIYRIHHMSIVRAPNADV